MLRPVAGPLLALLIGLTGTPALAKKSINYVMFPDEGHGFLRRENWITAQEADRCFLDQYLRH